MHIIEGRFSVVWYMVSKQQLLDRFAAAPGAMGAQGRRATGRLRTRHLGARSIRLRVTKWSASARGRLSRAARNLVHQVLARRELKGELRGANPRCSLILSRRHRCWLLSHFEIFSSGGLAGVALIGFGLQVSSWQAREAAALNRHGYAATRRQCARLFLVAWALSGVCGQVAGARSAIVWCYLALSFGTRSSSAGRNARTGSTSTSGSCSTAIAVTLVALIPLLSGRRHPVRALVLRVIVFTLVGAVSEHGRRLCERSSCARSSGRSASDPAPRRRCVPSRAACTTRSVQRLYLGRGARSYRDPGRPTPRIRQECPAVAGHGARLSRAKERLQLDFLLVQCVAGTPVESDQYIGENPPGRKQPRSTEAPSAIAGRSPLFLNVTARRRSTGRSSASAAAARLRGSRLGVYRSRQLRRSATFLDRLELRLSFSVC